MRIYSAADEQAIRIQALVREWTRSGLLEPAQRAAIEEEVHVDLTRTNTMLRAGLALFTAIVVLGSVALVGVLLDVSDRTAVATLLALGAIACYAAAEWIVRSFRVYRYGVEEMLAVVAVVLLAIAVAAGVERDAYAYAARIALTVAAIAALAVYLRFGFLYAAIGAMACLAAVPFQLGMSTAWQRAAATGALAVVGAIARAKRKQHPDDFAGDEYAMLQAAAFVGVYLMINLKIFTPPSIFYASPEFNRAFYWTTYALTWILPAAALWVGIREKERELIDAGIATALATLVTNKPYLGWPRHPWDPILLGVLLVAVAVVVRRWLMSGPRGERDGFTAVRLLAFDREAISRLGTVSVALPQPAPTANGPAAPPSGFSGGRSGGGGGGGEF